MAYLDKDGLQYFYGKLKDEIEEVSNSLNCGNGTLYIDFYPTVSEVQTAFTSGDVSNIPLETGTFALCDEALSNNKAVVIRVNIPQALVAALGNYMCIGLMSRNISLLTGNTILYNSEYLIIGIVSYTETTRQKRLYI